MDEPSAAEESAMLNWGKGWISPLFKGGGACREDGKFLVRKTI